MPFFRCLFLDDGGRIVYPAEITAADLEAAKTHAFDILEREQAVASNEEFWRPVSALEIWQGPVRVFRF